MTNIGGGMLLVANGVVISRTPDAPPVSIVLQNHSGAYTTTRTHSNVTSLLFWDRHLLRLADSIEILAKSRPQLFISEKSRPDFSSSSFREDTLEPLVAASLRAGLRWALEERKSSSRANNEELSVTTLVCGDAASAFAGLNVYVHFGMYVPPIFGAKENGARLAVVGCGREIARAKWSEWVRTRKYLEKFRPPLATELLLSNDGDRILEGSVTNFFVVCHKETSSTVGDLCDPKSMYAFEVQTAPVSDGILPGVIRQLVIDICLSKGIPVREVAPSWSNRKDWKEAFITNSLRLVQHVEKIQAPNSWKDLQSKAWDEVAWEEKRFEGLGLLSTEIQRELIERADIEEYRVTNFL